MIGLSPRPVSLTPKQVQTSTEISEAVPEFPVAISDLVSLFAAPDFSLAASPLELDDEGELIQNETNQRIVSMIEMALSSPTSECEAWIKSRIFKNGTKGDGRCRNSIKPYLAQIINRIKQEGEQINLDDVYLENLDLEGEGKRGLDLSGMSAQRVVLFNVRMIQSKLERADFTGAKFIDSDFYSARISKANITGAEFSNVTFAATVANGLTCNQSTILKCSRSYPAGRSSEIQEIYLNLAEGFASPDTDSHTLMPEKFSRPAQIT